METKEQRLNRWCNLQKHLADPPDQEEYDRCFEQLSIEELLDFELYLRWHQVFADTTCESIDQYLLERPQQLEEYLRLKTEQEDYFP